MQATVLIMMACVLWGWSVKKFGRNQQIFSLLQRESTSEEANIFSIVCKLRSEIHLRLNMVSILHKTRTNKIQVAWVAGINI